MPKSSPQPSKDNILVTATKEFARCGYNGLSMNQLAEKLSINKATIYYHYKDKKTLYQYVLKSIIAVNTKEVSAFLAKNALQMDMKKTFRFYIHSIVANLKNNPDIMPLFLREISNFGNDMDETIVPIIDEQVKYLKLILDKLHLKNDYKDIDPYIIICMIFGTISNYYALYCSPLPFKDLDRNKTPQELLDALEDKIANALLDLLCTD